MKNRSNKPDGDFDHVRERCMECDLDAVGKLYGELSRAPEDQKREKILQARTTLEKLEELSEPDLLDIEIVYWRARFLKRLNHWPELIALLSRLSTDKQEFKSTFYFHKALNYERDNDHVTALETLESVEKIEAIPWVSPREVKALSDRLVARLHAERAAHCFLGSDLYGAACEIEKFHRAFSIFYQRAHLEGLIYKLHCIYSFREEETKNSLHSEAQKLETNEYKVNLESLVFVSGFGYSGSGAVADYLRGHSDVTEPDYPFDEFVFLGGRCGSGSAYAILRACDKKDHSLVARSIVNFAFTALLGMPVTIGENGKISSLKRSASYSISRSVIGFLTTHRSVDPIDVIHRSERFAAGLDCCQESAVNGRLYCNVKRALFEFSVYVFKATGWDGKKTLLLNNSLTADRLRVFDVFSGARLVVVRRDPRDRFVSRVMEAGNIDRSVEANIALFSKRFSLFSIWRKKEYLKNALYVDFEQFVKDETVREAVLRFLGLSSDGMEKVSKFDPIKSKNNVGIHESWPDQKAIAMIYDSLAEKHLSVFKEGKKNKKASVILKTSFLRRAWLKIVRMLDY